MRILWHHFTLQSARLLSISGICVLSVFCISCKNEVTPELKPVDMTSLSDEKLAMTVCGRCHLYPEPSLLDKSTWTQHVLPEMAYYVGIKPLTEKMFATNEKDFKGLIESGYFPDKPLLLQKDWDRIVAYYKNKAPDSLLDVARSPLQSFPKVSYDLVNAPKGELPFISLTKYIGDKLYVCNANTNTLTIYNESKGTKDTMIFSSPVVDLIADSSHRYILQIGMMNPNDRFLGRLTSIDAQQNKTEVIDSLNRPVDVNMTDLNSDGVEDFVVCNFGDKIGSLAWYDGRDFAPHILAALPGSRVTHIRDFDNDGRNDIMALFSQGREKISIFYNKGKGHFDEVVLATFPSVYGSSYIDLADIDGDGHEDILYTSGDNADLSKIAKPYHGLYLLIYKNKDKYEQKYFYALHGASMVKGADLDGDKDNDIIVASYFPTTSDKDRIIILENESQKSQLRFSPGSLKHTSKGNWLVMDFNPESKAMVFGCMSFPQTGNQGGVELIKIKPLMKGN